MKFHWSIADQQAEFAVEYLGRKTSFPRINISFFRADYFMWGYEDKQSIAKRLTFIKLSDELKLVAFVSFMVLINVL